jgi:hypothetical protein
MLKKLAKKFHVYISIFYMLTKLFHGKDFCISFVKKIKVSLNKECLCDFFIFFTQATKNIGFS